VFNPVLLELGIFETGERVGRAFGFKITAPAFSGFSVVDQKVKVGPFGIGILTDFDFSPAHSESICRRFVATFQVEMT
jgi:hypothetical protein